jgi:methylenetetrahydrofolate reductase (NADPH)
LDALNSPRPSVSFEFFPPKDQAAAERLAERVARLAHLNPDFVSVTYGAGGGGTDAERQLASLRATEQLAGTAPAARVAHLTLTGHSQARLVELVERFLESKVEGFMALRGDPPGGPKGDWQPEPGGLRFATELVELIASLTDVPIGVAAFPYAHPTARSKAHDAEVLAMKQAAGAQFAITQVCFDAEAYSALLDRAQAAGATLPIIPGVMPVTGASSVAKLEAFSGAPLPTALAEQIESAASPEAISQVGIEWSVGLVRDLLAAGAPGVHFYTLNTSLATEAICHRLGLGGGAGGGIGG